MSRPMTAAKATPLLVGIGSNQAGQHRASQEGRPTANDPLLDELDTIGPGGQKMSPKSNLRIDARRDVVVRFDNAIGHGRSSLGTHQQEQEQEQEPSPAAGIPSPRSRPSSPQPTQADRPDAADEHAEDGHGQQEAQDPAPGGQPSDKKRKMPSRPAHPPPEAEAAPETISVDPTATTQKRQKRQRWKPPRDPQEAQEALDHPTPRRPRPRHPNTESRP